MKEPRAEYFYPMKANERQIKKKKIMEELTDMQELMSLPSRVLGRRDKRWGKGEIIFSTVSNRQFPPIMNYEFMEPPPKEDINFANSVVKLFTNKLRNMENTINAVPLLFIML